jgi:hypothetical protein
MKIRARALFHSRTASGNVTQQCDVPQRDIPPGDIPNTLAPGQKVKAEDIRGLAELIRKRYKLDVEIWSLRDVGSCDRQIVLDKMHRSDAALRKIKSIIRTWDRHDAFESQEDWGKLQQIKKRMEKNGKRTWEGNPPWK